MNQYKDIAPRELKIAHPVEYTFYHGRGPGFEPPVYVMYRLSKASFINVQVVLCDLSLPLFSLSEKSTE